MNVLIAINRSAESLHAVRKVALLPFREPPRVHLLVAIMEYHHLDMPKDMRRELAEEHERGAAEAIADARQVLSATGWEVHAAVRRGHPNSLILEQASSVDADVIALGAAGHNTAFRLVLGSTADYVANHAKCSVLVVRPDDTAPDGVALRGVVVAYDEGPRSRVAVDQALWFNWRAADAPLTLLRTLERPPLVPNYEIYDAAHMAQAEEKLAAVAAEFSDRGEVNIVVREAVEVGNAICQECSERHVSLVFIGDSGKGAVGRFFLGSVSRQVLHTVRGGVWIARAKH